MTFGEHLDELRSALIKALLSLAIGFLIGLMFGGNVVEFLQIPVSTALENYYAESSVDDFVESLQERIDRGESLGPVLENALALEGEERTAELKKLLLEEQFLPEEAYLDPAQIVGEIRKHYPDLLRDDVSLPESDGKRIRIYIWKPINSRGQTELTSIEMQEPFMVYIKASLLFGALISSPFIFYFIWSFVATGLYPHEKKYVHIFLPFSLALFLAGAALAFFAVFHYVLDFLLMFNRWMNIDPDPRINAWLSFAMMLPLGFGIRFQLPLVMLFLERIGVFTVQSYLAKWKIAVLIIFLLSMLLTPADPTSMILMAIPLTALYFLGILLCRFMPRRKTPFGETI